MILIVDDDRSVTHSLELLLKQAGYATVCAADPQEAVARLQEHEVQLVLQDMNFSRLTTGEEGLQLLARIKELRPAVPVILITAWGSIELAVAGMKAGATDFITKPWSNPQIVQAVGTALGLAAQRAAARETPPTREELDERYDFSGIIGNDAELLRILELVGRISGTDASVLVAGESGTGKEVIAEAIHRNSPRRDGPFVKVNLGGIASTLFESEMFGHVRGAFTDAHRDRAGRFARAEGGTIFLDEIGELDLRSQVKMLRVLQDRTFEVLGTSESRTLDVRVVSATNRDLAVAVDKGQFREDLLYRLNLIAITLPLLAQRPGDIPLLAEHFLALAIEAYGRPPVEITGEGHRWLAGYEWPGHIRQLKHLIERTLLVSDNRRLGAADFERTLGMELADGGRDQLPPVGSMTLNGIEKSMILKSLKHHGGNISRAAASLGMSRAALYRRLDKYGIKP